MVVWEHSQPRSTRHSQKWTRHAPSFCSQKPHFHIFSPWQKPHPSPLFLVPGTAWSSYRGSTPGPVQRPVRCSLTVRDSDGLHPGFGSTKKSSFSTDMELDIEIVPKKNLVCYMFVWRYLLTVDQRILQRHDSQPHRRTSPSEWVAQRQEQHALTVPGLLHPKSSPKMMILAIKPSFFGVW